MQFSTMGTPATLKRLSYTAQAQEHLHICRTSKGTDEQEHDAGKQGVYLRDVLIGNQIKGEPGLRVAGPGDALAAVLPDAPLLPLHRYLAAAERADTNHDLRDGAVSADRK